MLLNKSKLIMTAAFVIGALTISQNSYSSDANSFNILPDELHKVVMINTACKQSSSAKYLDLKSLKDISLISKKFYRQIEDVKKIAFSKGYETSLKPEYGGTCVVSIEGFEPIKMIKIPILKLIGFDQEKIEGVKKEQISLGIRVNAYKDDINLLFNSATGKDTKVGDIFEASEIVVVSKRNPHLCQCRTTNKSFNTTIEVKSLTKLHMS